MFEPSLEELDNFSPRGEEVQAISGDVAVRIVIEILHRFINRSKETLCDR